MARASVIIVTFNSAKHIVKCLESALSQVPKGFEVVVVDSASTDGTVKAVRRRFPRPRIITLHENLGYSAAVRAGAEATHGEFIVLLNPDAQMAPGCLRNLLAPFRDAKVAATTGKVLLADGSGRVNALGVAVNYLGFAWAAGCYSKDRSLPEAEIAAGSGCLMAIRRSAWDRAGGFDGEYFLYHEDVDLSWRLRMMGLRILLVPSAVAYHDYEPARHRIKVFYVERNRLATLLKNYQLRTLLLLTPALAAVEIGAFLYSLRIGEGAQKARGYLSLLGMLPGIIAKRGRIQGMRKVRDRELVRRFEPEIGSPGLQNPVLGAVNQLLRAYLALASKLM